jgi:hypothetical protein
MDQQVLYSPNQMPVHGPTGAYSLYKMPVHGPILLLYSPYQMLAHGQILYSPYQILVHGPILYLPYQMPVQEPTGAFLTLSNAGEWTNRSFTHLFKCW